MLFKRTASGLERSCAGKQVSHTVLLVVVSVLTISAMTERAWSESLRQALRSTYDTNPALQAQRKAVEAVDETVSQAQAGFRPRVVSSANAGHQNVQTDVSGSARAAMDSDVSTRPRGYQIMLTQSLFSGFQTVNSVREAEANVLVARENLRQIEQSTLLEAVTAYMDVLRDRELVAIRTNNIRILSRELRATRARLEVGDLTRTDVAQSEARLAASVSDLDNAKADLRSSRARYEQVIGHAPGNLVRPSPARRHMPDSIQEAKRKAVEETPVVVAAAFQELAAARAVDRVTGELLPTVNVEATYNNQFEPSDGIDQTETASVIGRLSFPLYQGGEVYARIRQARRIREQRQREIDDVRRRAQTEAVTAWSNLLAARARLRSDKKQVRSARLALKGVREEEKVGQRSLVDVLDAQQELLNAQETLARTRRDIVVASYSVVSSTGRLTAADLNLKSELHDPSLYYDLVRAKPWGTRVILHEGYEGYVDTEVSPDGFGGEAVFDDVRRIATDARAWAHDEVERRRFLPSDWGEILVEKSESWK